MQLCIWLREGKVMEKKKAKIYNRGYKLHVAESTECLKAGDELLTGNVCVYVR